MELITKSDGVYKLTSLGMLEAQICKNCCQSFNTLEKYKDFWLTHDISDLPPTLMANIGTAIENSTLVQSTDVDLQKVHETFVDLLSSAKNILGISPIFHPDYIKAFKKVLSHEGNKIDLIVTSAVLEKIKQTDNELITKYLPEGNLQIFLNNNLKFASTVTEKKWALGLFRLSGEYDYSNELISDGEEHLKWGQQLFNNILEKSTKITTTES